MSVRVPTYKVRIFDRAGLCRAEAGVTADDDDEAVLLVSDHSLGHMMELWQGERLVKRFEAVEQVALLRRDDLA